MIDFYEVAQQPGMAPSDGRARQVFMAKAKRLNTATGLAHAVNGLLRRNASITNNCQVMYLAVLGTAVDDLCLPPLKGDHFVGRNFFVHGWFAPWAELAGLDPDFVLDVLVKFELLNKEELQ